MILFLADENERDVKIPYARWTKDRRSPQTSQTVTAAFLEEREWDAFTARIYRRKQLFGAGVAVGKSEEDNADIADLEEDDIDMLLSVIGVLERALDARPCRMLTVAEIVRELQGDKVLSVEFPAAARQQAQRMLGRLQSMSRVSVDAQGRWSLG